jgi:predicted RNA-binding Zn-ribbon protein involved in translation (DUF1610 family)
MKDPRSVSAAGRYVVTEKGALDLRCADTCVCDVRIEGILFKCPDCGTVYGSMRNSDRSFKRGYGKR